MSLDLEQLLFDGEFKDIEDPSELAKTARELQERLGSHVSTIIGYGSWVYGTQKPDSMKDFIVVVDGTEAFYRENGWLVQTPYVPFVRYARAQDFLNRLSPNYYHLDGGKVKIGVISQSQLVQEPDSFSKYIGFRLTKPLAIFQISEDGLSRGDLEDILAELREDNLYRTLNLLPRSFSIRDFALKYIGVSYEADVRFEDPKKIQTTYEASKNQFNRMAKAFLACMISGNIVTYSDDEIYTKHSSAFEHYKEVVAMKLRKLPFLAQNSLNFFTAADPVGYALRKIKLGTK